MLLGPSSNGRLVEAVPFEPRGKRAWHQAGNEGGQGSRAFKGSWFQVSSNSSQPSAWALKSHDKIMAIGRGAGNGLMSWVNLQHSRARAHGDVMAWAKKSALGPLLPLTIDDLMLVERRHLCPDKRKLKEAFAVPQLCSAAISSGSPRGGSP